MFQIVMAILIFGVLFLMFRRLAWRLWKREGVQALPKVVSRPLASQFAVGPDLLAKLRCRTKAGRYMGESVRYLGIFDPALVKHVQLGTGTYEALLTDRGALLFEARLWPSGIVLVEDRRAGQAAF